MHRCSQRKMWLMEWIRWLRLIYHVRLKKRKEIRYFWTGEASYEEVREENVWKNKGCLISKYESSKEVIRVISGCNSLPGIWYLCKWKLKNFLYKCECPLKKGGEICTLVFSQLSEVKHFYWVCCFSIAISSKQFFCQSGIFWDDIPGPLHYY